MHLPLSQTIICVDSLMQQTLKKARLQVSRQKIDTRTATSADSICQQCWILWIGMWTEMETIVWGVLLQQERRGTVLIVDHIINERWTNLVRITKIKPLRWAGDAAIQGRIRTAAVSVRVSFSSRERPVLDARARCRPTWMAVRCWNLRDAK